MENAGAPSSSTNDSSSTSQRSALFSSSFPRGPLTALLVLACAVPLAYSFYTDHIWEDSFITLRHSENLLRGDGLVFNPGERVHGFTSPINVLLLAVCSLLTGQTSYVATFWLYRLPCIVAFVAGCVLVARRLWAQTPTHPLLCAGAFSLLYVFDLKMVAFSTNGMETAFMLLFLGGALSRLILEDPSPWMARGLYWGGLMWSRPDGCVYIAALTVVDLLFSPGVRGKLLGSLAKSALLCAVVYLPWFGFAWSYYGSPIPQTVVAKGPAELGIGQRIAGVFDFFLFMECAKSAFCPIYGSFDEGRWLDNPLALGLLNFLSRGASIFCLIYWMFPVKDRWGRAASLCFVFITLYFTFMRFPSPWYLPPATLLALVALTCGVFELSDVTFVRSCTAPQGRLHPLAYVVLVLLIGGQITLCALNALEMRIRQTEIEMGSRYEIGMWLRHHGRSTESVYLEPLGYVGYFSGMHMIDWPGLVAPQVVKMRRERQIGQFAMIFAIRPDWVVLRKRELELFGPLREQLDRDYALENVFDATRQLEQHRLIPGKSFLYVDAVFGVFRRRDLRTDDFRY